MIKTKIEERSVGNTKRYYPMVQKTRIISLEKYWSTIEVLGENSVMDVYLVPIYYDNREGAEKYLENYLLDRGQYTVVKNWYPEYEGDKK